MHILLCQRTAFGLSLLCRILCPLNVQGMAGNDIAMNQFKVLTDVTYVYGEASDSSQGKIRKSDLLSKMFQYRGDVSENYDNFIENGIYQIYYGSNVTNAPDGISFGFLLVFKTEFYLAQIALEVRPSNMAVKLRTNSGSAWSGWKSVTLT